MGSWHEMFRVMLANPREDISVRGAACTLNMLSSDREIAEKIVETDITEILMALTKLPPGESCSCCRWWDGAGISDSLLLADCHRFSGGMF